MRYLSVCSGIEAATQAWRPLGWEAVAFSEIEAFPSAVLAHHYPTVPNLGDMTRFAEWPDAAVDLLVGGTPCQSFSVAGLRKGLRDPRGNLALVYLALADRYRPDWLVWENVPGVLSSNGGRDFGAFLGGLGELGYGFAYRVLDAQYVRTRRFGRAVPQRRRRVFVVGCLGDWRRAAAVLFDRESLLGNPPPRREAGERVAATLTRGAESGGKGGYAGRRREDDVNLIASTGNVSHCLNAGGMGRIDYETGTMIAHALRGEGFDASEDGTGRGTPLVPVMASGAVGANGCGIGKVGDPAFTLDTTGAQAIAFDTTQITSAANRSSPQPGDPCHPLAARAHPPAIAFGADLYNLTLTGDVAATLATDGGGTSSGPSVAMPWAVRRLTPTECEALQGFPRNFTAIPYRGKPAADGNRYRALGNSMAVNVMEWLGQRIALVDTIQSPGQTQEDPSVETGKLRAQANDVQPHVLSGRERHAS